MGYIKTVLEPDEHVLSWASFTGSFISPDLDYC
jgi:hypothetical protein